MHQNKKLIRTIPNVSREFNILDFDKKLIK